MKTHKPGRVGQLGANEMAGSGPMEGLHPRSICLYNKTADQLVSLTEMHVVQWLQEPRQSFGFERKVQMWRLQFKILFQV